eukprot:6191188-Pleurochrysis_carterae.AAC.1
MRAESTGKKRTNKRSREKPRKGAWGKRPVDGIPRAKGQGPKRHGELHLQERRTLRLPWERRIAEPGACHRLCHEFASVSAMGYLKDCFHTQFALLKRHWFMWDI